MKEKIKKILLSFETLVLATCILGISIDIFLFGSSFDLVVLFLTGLWVLSVWLYKFEGRVSVTGGLICLSLCPFLLIFKKELIAEKFAIWAYVFLVVGVAQIFIEYLKEERESAKKEER